MNTEEIKKGCGFAIGYSKNNICKEENLCEDCEHDLKIFNAGLEEGKKQVYKKSDTSYTYNKACEDIKLLNNKILGMVSANIINSEIRKLQEGKQ
jgi:hypothetical protein